MRAKMVVKSVTVNTENGTAGKTTSETVRFGGVCKDGPYPEDGSDEDNSFCLWSPWVELTMHINNPALWGKLPVGKKLYVDFTEAAS